MCLPKARKVNFELGDKVRVRHDKLLTFLQVVYSMKECKNLLVSSSPVTVHYKRLKNSRYVIREIEAIGEINYKSFVSFINDYEHNIRLTFKADTDDDNYLTALALPLSTWFSAYWFELCYPKKPELKLVIPETKYTPWLPKTSVPISVNVDVGTTWPEAKPNVPVAVFTGSKDRVFRFEE